MRAATAQQALNKVVGGVTVGSLKLLKQLNRRRMADFAGWTMRHGGPLLGEHDIGRANLAAAFPEKSTAEIEAILRGVWDNLGRFAVEFADIEGFKVYGPDLAASGDIVYAPEGYDRLQELRLDGKPALLFSAHLANWELPAYVAALVGLPLTMLYRRLNNKAVNDAVLATRSGIMGTLVSSDLSAPIKLLRALEQGSHVGVLVDQHLTQGVDVTFFGRACKANPLIAWLAQKAECPIHGVRAIRLADRNRFRVEITPAMEPARDPQGHIDVAGTMQRITDIIEGWVREYPDQWLWLHRRWR